MKRIAALVVMSALSATSCASVMQRPGLSRNTSWQWDNVVALPPGALIRVTTIDRRRHHGTLVAADAVGVRVATKDGAVAVPASSVRRVDRLEALPRSRARTALAAAAAGVAATLLTTYLFGEAVADRPYWPSAKSIAVIAAMFGGIGAVSNSGRPMTIYLRP